jgi:hypothetical protein
MQGTSHFAAERALADPESIGKLCRQTNVAFPSDSGRRTIKGLTREWF